MFFWIALRIWKCSGSRAAVFRYATAVYAHTVKTSNGLICLYSVGLVMRDRELIRLAIVRAGGAFTA